MASSISVITPIEKAFSTVSRLLFQPVDLAKWFCLGFTAWLAALTNSGGGGGLNLSNAFKGESVSDTSTALAEWVSAHLMMVVFLGVFAVAIVLMVSLVIGWISSRGKFMFLDNVIRNTANIRAPWAQYRREGNSYFLFSIAYGFAILAIMLVLVTICVLIASPDISRHTWGLNAISAVIAGGIFSIGLIVFSLIVVTFLDDFIVPIMALNQCRVMAAWKIFGHLLKRHTGSFVLYVLFKIVLCLAISALTALVCCCLCCTVLIPYIGTVILLPVHVFLRSYSLHFLEQMDDRYRMFENGPSQYITLEPEQPVTE